MKFKSFIQSLLKKNYHATHWYHLLRLWLEGKRVKDKIVIYQMGKVGSTTVWKSLESLSLDIPLYHVHTLNSEKIKKRVEYDKTNFSKRRFIYYESIQAEYLRSQLDKNLVENPWYVITLVRDPIAKMVSSFFQRLEIEIPLGLDYRERIEKEGSQEVLKEVSERFHQECFSDPHWKHPFEWLNDELKDNFNVDILKETPLSGKDYCIYETETAKVLLLKLESLDGCYQNAFQEFLGFKKFNLAQSNIGSQKQYKTLYKDFLQKTDFPINYIDAIYNTELVNHLYSSTEIEKFYQRWTSKSFVHPQPVSR